MKVNVNGLVRAWALVVTAFLLMGAMITFSPGDVISSADVNANFAELQQRLAAIEDGTTTSPLDADLLGGLASDELVRVSFSQAESERSITTQDPVELTANFVHAPVHGVVLVWGNANVELADDSIEQISHLALDLRVGGELSSVLMIHELRNPTLPTIAEATVAVCTLVPVVPGQHIVVLAGRKAFGGDTDLVVTEATLSTLFVPYENMDIQPHLD